MPTLIKWVIFMPVENFLRLKGSSFYAKFVDIVKPERGDVVVLISC